jgi:hypothetical protein
MNTRFGDLYRWQYKSGAVSAPQTVGSFALAIGDTRIYDQVWDRSLGCWIVYSR